MFLAKYPIKSQLNNNLLLRVEFWKPLPKRKLFNSIRSALTFFENTRLRSIFAIKSMRTCVVAILIAGVSVHRDNWYYYKIFNLGYWIWEFPHWLTTRKLMVKNLKNWMPSQIPRRWKVFAAKQKLCQEMWKKKKKKSAKINNESWSFKIRKIIPFALRLDNGVIITNIPEVTVFIASYPTRSRGIIIVKHHIRFTTSTARQSRYYPESEWPIRAHTHTKKTIHLFSNYFY